MRIHTSLASTFSKENVSKNEITLIFLNLWVSSTTAVDIAIMFRIMLFVSLVANSLFANSQEVALLNNPRFVSGTVLDEDGKPLPGANVTIPGVPVGVTSDMEGNYSLQIPNQYTPICFSYYGYESVILCPDNRIRVDVVLSKMRKGFKNGIWRIRYPFKSKKYKNPCLPEEAN